MVADARSAGRLLKMSGRRRKSFTKGAESWGSRSLRKKEAETSGRLLSCGL